MSSLRWDESESFLGVADGKRRWSATEPESYITGFFLSFAVTVFHIWGRG